MAILAKEVKPGKLGVDKEWPARFLIHMMELRPDAPVMNGSIFVDMTRMVKDAEEQEKLRRSSAMNDGWWPNPLRRSRKGCQKWIWLRRSMNFSRRRAPQSKACASWLMANTAPSRTTGPSKEVFLQPGDNVLFDIGKNLDGYYSDMTRTVCYKSATDLQRKDL